jgi:predicted component of viral defense system (DUF524 family)
MGNAGEDIAKLNIWAIKEQIKVNQEFLISDRPHIEAVLVEGSTYGYELEICEDRNKTQLILEPHELFEPDKIGSTRGRLRIGNRAGILIVSLTLADSSFSSVCLEIVSAKLRYEDEYRWMLRDITSELAELALMRFGASQSVYKPTQNKDSKVLYQKFAFLQAILESDEYQQALSQVLSSPYVAWVQDDHVRPTSRGLRSSHKTLRALATGTPRRHLPKPIRKLDTIPLEVPGQKLKSTTDNLPNQFIKALLEDWRGLAQEVFDALTIENKAASRSLAPVIRGLSESQRLINNLDSVLATQLFQSTSHLRQLPRANQVLMRRPGYRELVRLYHQAQLAAQLSWDGSEQVFGAGQRDVATLYEYWVFLQVGRIVADFCGSSFDYANLFQLSNSGLQLHLRQRRAQVVSGVVTVNGLSLDVELWFNRSFSYLSGESWSRNMRPDLSLSIKSSSNQIGSQHTWMHFDAKYKVESLVELLGSSDEDDISNGIEEGPNLKKSALREDLLKMHAYRDAIRRSSGAYVIYPGDDNENSDETFLEFHELLPGLGAFALRPSEEGAVIGESGIRKFIGDVFNHAGDALSRDRRSQYWLVKSQGIPPKPAKKVPVISHEISDLWFLDRPPADETVLIAKTFSNIVWSEHEGLLLFRVDGPASLPSQIFRSHWIVLVTLGEEIDLLKLDDEPLIEELPENLEIGSGQWLAIRATRKDFIPEWLGFSTVNSILSGGSFVLLTWDQLANQLTSNLK